MRVPAVARVPLPEVASREVREERTRARGFVVDGGSADQKLV